jgi:hypothetical protein
MAELQMLAAIGLRHLPEHVKKIAQRLAALDDDKRLA